MGWNSKFDGKYAVDVFLGFIDGVFLVEVLSHGCSCSCPVFFAEGAFDVDGGKDDVGLFSSHLKWVL